MHALKFSVCLSVQAVAVNTSMSLCIIAALKMHRRHEHETMQILVKFGGCSTWVKQETKQRGWDYKGVYVLRYYGSHDMQEHMPAATTQTKPK